MQTHFEHFVFDLYGTLVDIHTDEGSARLWRETALYLSLSGVSWKADALRAAYARECDMLQRRADAALAAQGIPCPAEIDIRKAWMALLSRPSRAATVKEAERVCRLFRALSIRKLRLFPGAMETLRALRKMGKGVYLLTNAQSAFTRPELAYLKLGDAFDGILISSEAGIKKPSPAFFQALTTRYELNVETTVMIGNDETCDCCGAQAVGWKSLYLHTEQSPPRSGPLPEGCLEIQRLSDILRLI